MGWALRGHVNWLSLLIEFKYGAKSAPTSHLLGCRRWIIEKSRIWDDLHGLLSLGMNDALNPSRFAAADLLTCFVTLRTRDSSVLPRLLFPRRGERLNPSSVTVDKRMPHCPEAAGPLLWYSEGTKKKMTHKPKPRVQIKLIRIVVIVLY